MKRKSDVFITFKQWKALIEKQIGKKIKRLKTDCGLKFYPSEFNEFCKNERIIKYRIARNTP